MKYPTTRSFALSVVTIVVTVAVVMLRGSSVYASTDENTIYTFNETSEGIQPYGQLITDGLGDLYGTTTYPPREAGSCYGHHMNVPLRLE
jgi:hypothetical protein